MTEKVFTIVRDYYDEGDYLYTTEEVEIIPGITVLVGCNGSGKSTLIHQIKDQLESENIPFYHFDNLSDGGGYARSVAVYFGDMDFAARGMTSSEGENIRLNIENMAGRLGHDIRKKYKDTDQYWILLDAIDSGLSVDNIVELKDLLNMIIELESDKDIYILIAANEYELARGEECFDVTNCMYRIFKDYESYREFILKSREYKNKRYGGEENEKED